jgi:hypothetical protein
VRIGGVELREEVVAELDILLDVAAALLEDARGLGLVEVIGVGVNHGQSG